MHKFVELRLCSLRAWPKKGLSDLGVRLASAARTHLDGPYDAYASSPRRRAKETLWALGFPVFAVDECFGPVPAGIKEWISTPGWPVADPRLGRYPAEILEALKLLAEPLHEGGRVLVLSHVLTIKTVAMMSAHRVADWPADDALRPLEGIRIAIADGALQSVGILRLPDAFYQSLSAEK